MISLGIFLKRHTEEYNWVYVVHTIKRSNSTSNWIKEISFKMESGDQKEELSHHTTHPQSQTPSTGKCLQFPTPSRGRFSLCLATVQPMRNCHNSANEKPPHFKLPSQPFNCNSSTQLPHVLHKRAFLSFVLHTYLWFFHSVLVPDCGFLLFSHKPIFCY